MLLHSFQPLAAIATTLNGVKQLLPLCEAGATLWVPQAIAADVEALNLPTAQWQVYDSLKAELSAAWQHHRGFVFCLATGAVVRLMAPLLQDKATDPAIVVVDERGVAISLCGGHQAGADALTRSIALQLGLTPILTGAANALNLPGIDTLGNPFGWVKGTGDWTAVSAAIARQESVQVVQEAGSTLWQPHLPQGHSFQFPLQASGEMAGAQVWISAIDRSNFHSDLPQVQWHPRVLWVGMGCERGTPEAVIDAAITQVFQAKSLAEAAIAGIATIDLKADEPGLLKVCRDRHFPLHCFSAAALRSISVPNPSAVVEAEVGTPSVAEAAALLASRQASQAEGNLLVAKQIVRLDGQRGAVTIAVAQASRELIDRTGQLWLIGTGPGALEQITPSAKTAIAQADVVIGYSLYINLIQPLLRPGQIVEALPITQERQRALRAINLAQWGLTVAVVSSGDCGIYGMAGLVLEELQNQGWDGNTPAIQVFPGITALQAAAARVGAPLMHDFCAISLSDLLTPWAVIETRLMAAAQADFVVALYNPRSQTRIEQLVIAQQIFLQHRDPQTPVAVVRAAYRQDEQITLTTLGEMLDSPIDMLTIVLIGNQSTQIHARWMITPRGYSSKSKIDKDAC